MQNVYAQLQLSEVRFIRELRTLARLRGICKHICELRWYHESSRPYTGEGLFVFKNKY